MSDYTPSMDRIGDMYSWAYAWRTRDDVDETDLSGMRASQRAEFDRALAAHDAAVVAAAKAEGLEEFAVILRERYPEDVFKPMLDSDHRSVNDAMAGRRPNTIVSRDRVSADMMRRAATQADEQADEIRKEATS